MQVDPKQSQNRQKPKVKIVVAIFCSENRKEKKCQNNETENFRPGFGPRDENKNGEKKRN